MAGHGVPPPLPGFQRQEQLGVAGTFGVAYRELDVARIEFVAIKYMRRTKLDAERARCELLNQHKLRHPHVVGFRRAILTDTHLAIVLELCSAHTLIEFVLGQGGEQPRASEAQARCAFAQVLRAIAFAHSHYVVHRDLSLNNVFLAAPTLAPGGLPICKVADLGGSKDLGVNSACDTFIGSAQFIPPEVYAGVLGELDGVQAPTYDGRAMDVWSMGVMLHIMLRGNYMFQKSATDCDGTAQGKALAREGRLAKVLTDEAERMAKAGWISPGCHRVLLACFTVDPAARPTAAALLEDAWVKEGAAMLPQLPPAPEPEQTEQELVALLAQL